MKQYLQLLQTVLAGGEWQENRTGIRTLSYPGAQMRFDLREGFPALTVRKLAFKSSVSEMLGFVRGYNSAAQFRELGSKVWDQNANENEQWLANPFREGTDHLGRVYGVQWRDWKAFKLVRRDAPAHIGQWLHDRDWQCIAGDIPVVVDMPHVPEGWDIWYTTVDQLGDCIAKILTNPQDRRIIFHGWNPADLDEMALPPCHLLYQFHPNPVTQRISMTLYIRSNDLGLGAPFNVCGAAALLSLIGRVTGYEPHILTIQIGDAHIYENHLDMVDKILQREPLPAPRLVISDKVPTAQSVNEALSWLDSVTPDDFHLEGYEHHEPISAPMAV